MILCHRDSVRREVGQQGQLEGHAGRECGLQEAVDLDHNMFLGFVELSPPLDHFKGHSMQIITILEKISDDRHEDKNIVIKFMNLLQTHQWRMVDSMNTLVQRKKRLIEKLDQVEAHLAHMKTHVHFSFNPPSPPSNVP